MRRTTISLQTSSPTLSSVKPAAGRCASAIARDALSDYLGFGRAGEIRELPFAALGGSGHHTTARDMEELLEREWAPDARGR